MAVINILKMQSCELQSPDQGSESRHNSSPVFKGTGLGLKV